LLTQGAFFCLQLQKYNFEYIRM